MLRACNLNFGGLRVIRERSRGSCLKLFASHCRSEMNRENHPPFPIFARNREEEHEHVPIVVLSWSDATKVLSFAQLVRPHWTELAPFCRSLHAPCSISCGTSQIHSRGANFNAPWWSICEFQDETDMNYCLIYLMETPGV